MTPDEIVKQLQQIVGTLQQIVLASAALAERVETLEQQSGQKVGAMTSVQGHLQVLLETYQKQVTAQEATNRTVLDALGTIEARLDAIEGRGVQPSVDRPELEFVVTRVYRRRALTHHAPRPTLAWCLPEN